MKIVAVVARILLGLMFFAFGLNPFLKFLPMPPLEGVWGQFLGALVVSHYVWVCGCGAGHQRSSVSDWEVRSPGDCVEWPSRRQHNCLSPDDAAQRGTAGGSGNHMLGDSVLALPCFVCAPVGAKSIALDSTFLGSCAEAVL